MAELAFLRHGEEVMCYQLHQSSVRVGRGPKNDLVLPASEPGVSRYHLIVEKKHNQFWLRALSEQGITLNGETVQYHALHDGDRVILGRYQIEFRHASRNVVHTSHALGVTSTKKMSEGEKSEAQRASLTWVEDGHKKQVWIEDHPITLGKHTDNQITLNESYVSSYHCRIYQKEGRFFLRDLDSLNGTWVNGVKVLESELPEEAEIYVGKFPLQFDSREQGSFPAAPSSDEGSVEGLIGQSGSLKRALTLAKRMAPSDFPILIEGESGTGKELFARAMHGWSSRSAAPFVAINCGAISKDLMESTLFGHEKGAFTGASEARPGVFEQAGEGTLFLDEIGDLPLEQQVAFLRVLETGSYRRIGAIKERKTHARVFAATHKNLRQEVHEGRFREDLLFRISVLRLPLPALRDREGDLELLVEHFSQIYAPHRNIRFSPAAMERLRRHPWSGNVRELRNAIQRALIMADGDEIEAHELLLDQFEPQEGQAHSKSLFTSGNSGASMLHPPAAKHSSTSTGASPGEARTLKEIEKQAIVDALNACDYNISQAARTLGIGRASLYSKMDRFGLRDKSNHQN